MLFLCAVLLGIVLRMYACQLSLLQLLIWASYRHFYLDRLPEAICCCLQTYTVYDVLYYMCLPVFLSLVLIKGSYECIYVIYCLGLFVVV